MKKNSLIMMLSASLITGSAVAGSMGPMTIEPANTWVATLSLGPA